MKGLQLIWAMLAVGALALAGCSGGGGSGATPQATTPTNVSLTIGGKALNFSWSAGSNVDHYRISVNPDGVSGFTVDPYASNIANTVSSYSLEIPVHKTNWLAAQYLVEACDATEATCVA